MQIVDPISQVLGLEVHLEGHNSQLGGYESLRIGLSGCMSQLDGPICEQSPQCYLVSGTQCSICWFDLESKLMGYWGSGSGS